MLEITISVFEFGKIEIKQLYFNLNETIGVCKKEICCAFGVEDHQNTLYRVDAFEEPTYALRRLKASFSKSNVSSGDLLCLKSDKQLLPDELLKLSVHQTRTGFSHDSSYIGDIEVSKDFTLNELKEVIIDMEKLKGLCDALESDNGPSENTNDFLRVREKIHSGFFGRILREGNRSLKQLNLKGHQALVVQILSQPERLTNP